MNKCLNCGKEIIQKNGGKERKFCDNNNACKQAYHNKQKKTPKYVQFSSFQALKDELDKVKAEYHSMQMVYPKGVKDENVEVKKAIKEGRVINVPENQSDKWKEIVKYAKGNIEVEGIKKTNMDGKPEKMKGESGMDYAIRLAEWKEKQK